MIKHKEFNLYFEHLQTHNYYDVVSTGHFQFVSHVTLKQFSIIIIKTYVILLNEYL